MWKHLRWGMIGLGYISAGLFGLATQSIPETIVAADGLLVTNLKWLGWNAPPKALATGAADHFVVVVSLCIILLAVFAFVSKWIEARWLKRAVAPIVQAVRHMHHKDIKVGTAPEPSLSMVLSPAPQHRDTSLSEALAYAVYGQWGMSYSDVILAGGGEHGEIAARFRQLAFDGALPVWGEASGLFEQIPKEYWRDHQIRLMDIVGPDRKGGAYPFRRLMLNRAAVERAWPHEG